MREVSRAFERNETCERVFGGSGFGLPPCLTCFRSCSTKPCAIGKARPPVLACRAGSKGAARVETVRSLETMSKRIYVGGLPYSATEEDLENLFATAGN